MSSTSDIDSPLPLDIIYSCHICHATVSDLYRNLEGDKGFRDDQNILKQRPVTKLWLTSCIHLTCAAHLEGQGIPIHRSAHTPEASCPVCVAEKDDHTLRKFYGIQGFDEDQHDSFIPSFWFNTPPLKPSPDNGPMDALRFQYISLIRFGSSAYVRNHALTKNLENAVKKCENAKSQMKKLTARIAVDQRKLKSNQARLDELEGFKKRAGEAEQRLSGLEQTEKELDTWKQRESRILYYLGLFHDTVQDNTRLKDELDRLHFQRSTAQSDHVHDQNGLRARARLSNRFDTGTTRTLSAWTGIIPTRDADNHSERVNSAESHILMPPPPRPSEGGENPHDKVASLSTSAYSFEHATDTAKRSRIASGRHLLDSDIVLCEDGTWSVSEDASACLRHPDRAISRAERQSLPTSRHGPGKGWKPIPLMALKSDNVNSPFMRSPLSHQVSRQPNEASDQQSEQHNTWLPQQFPPNIWTQDRGFGPLAPMQRQQHTRPSADRTFPQLDGIGQHQTTRQADAKSEPMPMATRTSPLKRDFSRPLAASSPMKRRMVESNTAASPFFAPRTSSQHVGRMSLMPNRVRSSSHSHVSKKKPNPAFQPPTPQRSPKRTLVSTTTPHEPRHQQPTRATLLAPSSARDSDGLFTNTCRDPANELSRYFSNSPRASKPSRAHMFSRPADRRPQSLDKRQSAQAYSQLLHDSDRTIPRSGRAYVDTVSLLQQRRQQRGERHLGDFL